MNRSPLLVAASLLIGAIASPRAGEPAPLPPRPGLESPSPPQDRLQTEEVPPGVETIRITPVVRAVRKAGPSVVNIQVGEIIETTRGPVFNKLGEGSGVIVSEEGLLLTNWHVVRFRDRVANFACRVTMRDGPTLPAKVLNVSRENDLALLLVTPPADQPARFAPIAMGDSDTLMVGETVIAIGNPRGQQNTVTTGVLSAVNRALTVTPIGERRPIEFKELLQTDAAINPGNSGGALLDITGRLIGINTLMQVESQNIGFAIPVNHVRKVFEDKLLNVQYLGLWTGLDVEDAAEGITVTDVVAGGPGDLASIRRGDRIVRVGERPVANRKDLAKALITYSPGQAVPFYVRADGETELRSVEGWSSQDAVVYQRAGLLLERLDGRKNYGLARQIATKLYETYGYDGGVDLLRVRRVQAGGPADDLGIRVGDLVLGFLDFRGYFYPLTGGVGDLASALQQTSKGESPWLSIYRPKDGLLRGRLTVRQP